MVPYYAPREHALKQPCVLGKAAWVGARRRADGAIHVKHDDLGRLPLMHLVDPGAGEIGEVVDWRRQLGFNLKVLTCLLERFPN